MKRLLFFVLLFCAAATASAQSNVIKFNPLNLIFGRIQLGYERALNEHITVGGWVHATTFAIGQEDLGGRFSLLGFGAIPEFRFYPMTAREAPRGFFVGGYAAVNYNTLRYKVNDPASNISGEGSVSAVFGGGGFMLGYQFVIADVFAIDLFGGAGYYGGSFGNYDVRYSDGTVSESSRGGGFHISGFLPRFGLGLGYAF